MLDPFLQQAVWLVMQSRASSPPSPMFSRVTILLLLYAVLLSEKLTSLPPGNRYNYLAFNVLENTFPTHVNDKFAKWHLIQSTVSNLCKVHTLSYPNPINLIDQLTACIATIVCIYTFMQVSIHVCKIVCAYHDHCIGCFKLIRCIVVCT